MTITPAIYTQLPVVYLYHLDFPNFSRQSASFRLFICPLQANVYVVRYHIGESLLPSVRHYLRFIDAEDKAASHGFVRKVRVLR